MSNVTSQSELTTKEIVEQAISDYHAAILPYLAKGNNGYSETPIGAMQMFDDDTAPSGWLVADGTVYDIDDYPFLASHIERVHGSKNYYGGNGTTTFAVPDWQGEFFRASGTNSHTNQGSGASVGTHQDGTIIGRTATNGTTLYSYNDQTDYGNTYDNPDKHQVKESGAQYISLTGTNTSEAPATYGYTIKPTNTSLLCCIKAVPAGINYSTEEQEIGTWIDDKTIYQKTYVTTSLSGTDSEITTDITNVDLLLSGKVVYTRSDGAQFCELSSTNSSTWTTQSAICVYNDGGTIGFNYRGSIAIKSNSNTYVTVCYTKTTD